MSILRIAAALGAPLLVAALATRTFAGDPEIKKPFGAEPLAAVNDGPLGDGDKFRTRGAAPSEVRRFARAGDKLAPVLLIYLLQQSRFSDGVNLLQPIDATR